MNAKRVFRHSLIIAVWLVSSLLASAGLAQSQATIFYVKPGLAAYPERTCASWADACDLQLALVKAATLTPPVEIWVAEGTYIPGTLGASTFQLLNQVGLFGGFSGAETARGQRDPETHITILSGDLLANDGPSLKNRADNAFHVVTGSGTDATAILDGFTIRGGGNGVDPMPKPLGGGMINQKGSPTLANITFTDNWAGYSGGGVANEWSNPTLTNVIFIGNTSIYGGGMANWNSKPILNNVAFSANKGGVGGGMLNWNNGDGPSLNYVNFSNNSAARGGGMYNYSSNPTLTNVTFTANSSLEYGGGLFNQESFPVLTNIIFFANSTDGVGGGIYNYLSSPILTNVTFSNNLAGSGGGIFTGYGNPILTNCILWGNTATGAASQISGTPSTVTYSDVQGGYAGTGNIDADPLFVDAVHGNLRLLPGSPAIEAGSNAAVPASVSTDLDGLPRFVDFDRDGNAQVDLGVYETQVWYKLYLPALTR